jgi:hypothetical protein
MNYYLVSLIFCLVSMSSMATDSLPVDFHHYLNVLGASEGTIIVQSHAVDNLDVKLRKDVYRIQSASTKLNEWINKKTETGTLRYRISTIKNKNKFKIEYERTESLPDGRSLKFSGITYVDKSGQ